MTFEQKIEKELYQYLLERPWYHTTSYLPSDLKHRYETVNRAVKTLFRKGLILWVTDLKSGQTTVRALDPVEIVRGK